MADGRPTSKRMPAGTSPAEMVALTAVGLLAAATAILWAAAQLATLISSGRWLPVGLAESLPAALHLLQHPSDLAGAWDPAVAGLLPGPALYWTIVVLLLAIPFAAALWWLRRRAAERPVDEPARWATKADLKPLIVKRPTGRRLTLGTAHGRLLAAEPGHSLLVMGPTQSGKTSGLAIPAILDWDGPVVATSVKTDLLADTLAQRSKRGETWVYDPTGSTPGTPTAAWTPLDGCHDWQGALQTADWLTDAAKEHSLDDAGFWYANAAKLLAPLLYAAATGGRTMDDVVRWVDTQNTTEPSLELHAAGLAQAIHAFDASTGREQRARSSVYTTAETVLRCFANPTVAAASTRHSELSPDRLLDGGRHTLYITAPLHEQARLRPLFTALVQTVLTAAYRHANTHGRLDPPLLLVLDEAANIAPLKDLAQIASTAASLGIQLVTIWQDRAQITTRYGRAANTVINNHRARLLLSGIADTDTTTDAARTIGDTHVTRESLTVGAAGQQTRSTSTQVRPLASAADLRQLKPFEGVLLYGHLPPARLRLLPWFCGRRR